jgi:hypothetical protein
MNAQEFNGWCRRIKSGDADWVREFVQICRDYLDGDSNLHVVLEDGNLQNHHLIWSEGYCCGKDDVAGRDIAKLLYFMSYHQRKRIYRGLCNAPLPRL